MSRNNLKNRSSHSYSYGNFGPSSFSKEGQVSILNWAETEAQKRLQNNPYAAMFFHLAPFFQPQINPLYCGIASAVIVLNALHQPTDQAPDDAVLNVKVPESEEIIKFPAFSQITLLGEETHHVKAKTVVEYREKNAQGAYKPGLSLLELKGIIESHDTKVQETFPASEKNSSEGLEKFRQVIKEICSQTTQHLIIHFRSDLIGGIPRGHISPIGAYHEATDTALVMDVASHKGPWFWAPISELYQAMSATYDTQLQGGGYLIVSQK